MHDFLFLWVNTPRWNSRKCILERRDQHHPHLCPELPLCLSMMSTHCEHQGHDHTDLTVFSSGGLCQVQACGAKVCVGCSHKSHCFQFIALPAALHYSPLITDEEFLRHCIVYGHPGALRTNVARRPRSFEMSRMLPRSWQELGERSISSTY